MTEDMRSVDESEEAIGIYQEALGRAADEKWDKSVNHDSGHVIWDSPEPEYQQDTGEYAGDIQNAIKARKSILELEDQKKEIDKKRDENAIRRQLGTAAIRFVALQLCACDTLMFIYVIVQLRRGDAIASPVLISWMSTSLVEIIGILWVIARSLFPFRDTYRDRALEKHQ